MKIDGANRAAVLISIVVTVATPTLAVVVFVNTLLVTVKQNEPCFYATTQTALTDPDIKEVYIQVGSQSVGHWTTLKKQSLGWDNLHCVTIPELAESPTFHWVPGQWYWVEFYVVDGPFFRAGFCTTRDPTGNLSVQQDNSCDSPRRR